MGDQERLAAYVDVWWECVEDLLALLESLAPDEWAAPTDLSGWDVKAIASHTAHLESVLAGGPDETAEVVEAAHIKSPMATYTEIGVINRRDVEPEAIIAEIREACSSRLQRLRSDPPKEASQTASPVFGGMPWTWELLLRNRPLDIWMHEQDIRRALDRPGGMNSAGAQHTADYLMESFGFVLAKKAKASPGTSAALSVEGSEPVRFHVTDDGKGRVAPPESINDPTVSLAMSRESFILLAGGRRALGPEAVTIGGDAELGEHLLASMATVP